MKKIWRQIVFLTMIFSLTLGSWITGHAAKNDADEINGCTLTVTSDIQADSGLGDLDVRVSGDRCSIDSFGFVGAGSSWKPGQIPKVKVVVTAADGYVFSTKVNAGRITVKGGDCTGVKRLNSGESIEVTIRLKAVSGEMGEITDAFWVTSPVGKAKWDSADNASAYELKLFCGNTLVKRVDKTTTTYYDFYPYMTKKGDYYFKVRPVPRSSNESDYLDPGEWITSNTLTIDRTNVASENTSQRNLSGAPTTDPYANGDHVPFGWVQEGSRWWYHQADGSYPAGQWSYISDKWYLFDKAGYMLSGWQLWSGHYYYLTSNGDMVTGWLENDKRWYYLNPSDGHMMTGWLEAANGRYYLNSDGTRAAGWVNIDGKWHYFSPVDGLMAVNTTVGTYYVNSDGVWVQ